MIIDSINNGRRYTSLHPLFGRVFDYLDTTDVTALDPGVYEIEGGDLSVTVSYANLRPVAEAPLEVHDKFIDIQYLFEGEEVYGWRGRSDCSEPCGEMDIEKDIMFFNCQADTYFTLKPGQFCILFPEDAHAPLVGTPERSVKKCIFKVRV